VPQRRRGDSGTWRAIVVVSIVCEANISQRTVTVVDWFRAPETPDVEARSSGWRMSSEIVNNSWFIDAHDLRFDCRQGLPGSWGAVQARSIHDFLLTLDLQGSGAGGIFGMGV
jgi:hypothetical protein